jgi:hypothetical protein
VDSFTPGMVNEGGLDIMTENHDVCWITQFAVPLTMRKQLHLPVKVSVVRC